MHFRIVTEMHHLIGVGWNGSGVSPQDSSDAFDWSSYMGHHNTILLKYYSFFSENNPGIFWIGG